MTPKLLGNEERGRKERGRKGIIPAPPFPSYPKIFITICSCKLKALCPILTLQVTEHKWNPGSSASTSFSLPYQWLSKLLRRTEPTDPCSTVQEPLLFKPLNLLPAEEWWLQSHGRNKWVKNKDEKREKKSQIKEFWHMENSSNETCPCSAANVPLSECSNGMVSYKLRWFLF